MLNPSVYKRRNELYRKSEVLQSILLDGKLEFDKYYKIKMQEEDAYQRWKFYNNLIKEINKKDTK